VHAQHDNELDFVVKFHAERLKPDHVRPLQLACTLMIERSLHENETTHSRNFDRVKRSAKSVGNVNASPSRKGISRTTFCILNSVFDLRTTLD
jgi:hypothetical protein